MATRQIATEIVLGGEKEFNQAMTTVNNIKTIINGLKAWGTSRLNCLAENLGKKIDAIKSTADAAKSTADAAKSTAANAKYTADEAISKISSKADRIDPTVEGSFSQNRKEGTTVGGVSHAEGSNTTASGYASHAEGGYTTASGGYSHVQGKYNIEDTKNKYAHIVGNGTSRDARSNAHTLDWDGVPWFKGRPQFGGNAQDDGAQTVMANGDTEITLKSASGKSFKITVSDDGTLTATEVTE